MGEKPKFRPLTPAGWEMLAFLKRNAIPYQEINPGQRERFHAEALIETFDAPSPYKTVKGTVPFARLTAAGLERLESRNANRR